MMSIIKAVIVIDKMPTKQGKRYFSASIGHKMHNPRATTSPSTIKLPIDCLTLKYFSKINVKTSTPPVEPEPEVFDNEVPSDPEEPKAIPEFDASSSDEDKNELIVKE